MSSTEFATPMLDELDRLRKVARDVQRMPFEIEQARNALLAGVETARHELSNYYAEVAGGGKASDTTEAKLKEAVLDAQDALGSQSWADRKSGAVLAGRNAQAAVERFVRDNMDAIISEKLQLAEQTRSAVLDQIDTLRQIVCEYHQAAGGWNDIVTYQTGGPHQHPVPSAGRLDQAMRELNHVVAQGVPLAAPPTVLELIETAA